MRNEKSAYFGGKTLVKRIAGSIAMDISKGVYKVNQRLPSINDYSSTYAVARDTVEKAYGELKKVGIITAMQGRGYYVLEKPETRVRVLLLFNNFGDNKKQLYDALVTAFRHQGKIDLQIYQDNLSILEELVDTRLNTYDYFIVASNFATEQARENFNRVIGKVPPERCIVLTKDPNTPPVHGLVVHDIETDMFNILNTSKHLLSAYKQISVVCPNGCENAEEIKRAVKRFCKSAGMEFDILFTFENLRPVAGTVYIMMCETELSELLKAVKLSRLTAGNEIGIISAGDTIFKELLGITVVAIDQQRIARSIATQALTHKSGKVEVTLKMIIRDSV
ncbi:GntR family transcriptional regulator [Mucilaginibacter sp. HMF5004]|uniref:GntR family transcriptional regulator n=1 Tax=Mucilaginibacter rivuli TaxID=2857527 RepID=UPI001C5E1CD3|nr:GntR family transcriptional regulator [Mucilaginibacter rivuli]MBW4888971.1 GntR family transcriptional regulator [Mucilaginibacter rivuli]